MYFMYTKRMQKRQVPKAARAQEKNNAGAKKPAQNFYSIDTLGLPVPPVMVISGSIIFIGIVFVLHAISKIMA